MGPSSSSTTESSPKRAIASMCSLSNNYKRVHDDFDCSPVPPAVSNLQEPYLDIKGIIMWTDNLSNLHGWISSILDVSLQTAGRWRNSSWMDRLNFAVALLVESPEKLLPGSAMMQRHEGDKYPLHLPPPSLVLLHRVRVLPPLSHTTTATLRHV